MGVLHLLNSPPTTPDTVRSAHTYVIMKQSEWLRLSTVIIHPRRVHQFNSILVKCHLKLGILLKFLLYSEHKQSLIHHIKNNVKKNKQTITCLDFMLKCEHPDEADCFDTSSLIKPNHCVVLDHQALLLVITPINQPAREHFKQWVQEKKKFCSTKVKSSSTVIHIMCLWYVLEISSKS